MSNKILCGGFYLNDTLGVDENGKLGVNVDALSGGLIVTLTKDETNMEFTSSKRLYTADKTADEVKMAIVAGRNVRLMANYIDADGFEQFGIYHVAGYLSGDIAFINVAMVSEAVFAGDSCTIGYDSIILSASGVWIGSYTDLRQPIS